jgi:hypothetical protein
MDKLPALLVLLACVALLVRLLLPARPRSRVDAAARQAWQALRQLPRLRQRQQQQQQARDQAQAAINCARGSGPRKLH